MSVSALLAELTRSGIHLERRGDKLHVQPPPGMDTVALRQRLAEHKTELLEALKTKTCDKTALLARCKIACKDLPIEPVELYAAMDDGDRKASPSLETLRAFAESICESKQREPGEPELPAAMARAYGRLGHTLAENTSLRFACENLPDEGDDYILMAVGVKDAGFAVLRMPRKKYDGFRLIEMVDRWNHKGSNPE